MPRWNNQNCGFKKGHKPWNKGIVGLQKGRKITWGDKISKAKKGHYVVSEETKKKLRKVFSGKGNPRFGKHCSEETKRKISEKAKGRLTGDKSPNWKGGITPENHKIRSSTEMKLWRKAVFERDSFTCQKYGTKISGTLRAHHINNFADFPELRFAIDNGITFSEKAHIEFHRKYGEKNNNREQLNEFLSLK